MFRIMFHPVVAIKTQCFKVYYLFAHFSVGHMIRFVVVVGFRQLVTTNIVTNKA